MPARQHTYLFAEAASGDLYVAAEAVYAVFEQEIGKQLVEYAAEKIASVRSLQRTSV